MDPYHGQGGLGASSAQFIAVYLAHHTRQQQAISKEQLLADYLACTKQGKGLQPSVMMSWQQLQKGCVYLDRNAGLCQSYPWVFEDLNFILLRTGNKVVTHTHLQETSPITPSKTLNNLVELANKPFKPSKAAV